MLTKPVYNVNTQQRFQSIAEAASSIPGKNKGTVAGCIYNAINGKRRAYGYFWLLEENKDPNIELTTYLRIFTDQMKQRRQKANMCNAKTIINVDTQQVYNSVAEAAKAHNVKRLTLADACRRHYRCAGYYWQYIS